MNMRFSRALMLVITGLLVPAAILAGCGSGGSPPAAPESTNDSQPDRTVQASQSQAPPAQDVVSNQQTPAEPTTQPSVRDQSTSAAVPTQPSVSNQTKPESNPTPVVSQSQSRPEPSPAPASSQSDRGTSRTVESQDLEIVTLLGFDAIRAILEPEFVDLEQADEWLEPDHLVLGLSINGDSRAYSVPMLSAHEIVNDTVGGKPVAVTW